MNVYLIGYRGTGKTTVARLLADRLGWRAIDADERLEERAGCSIREIFAKEGEPSFRDRESQVLEELAALDQHVVSLGGGVILRTQNRARLKQGRVVWLHAPAKVLADRIARDPSTGGRRPNLTAQGGMEEVAKLLTEREPLYRECADFDVSTEFQTPARIAELIAGQVTRWLSQEKAPWTSG